MYRLYLLFCVMSGMVFGDSYETKYIDLLPEEEKQEFLNRIARRIIEEIKHKDYPEQSHAEVSDDQLNEHNDYVRDLIKEESENMRNERRDSFKNNQNGDTTSNTLEKDKIEENVGADTNGDIFEKTGKLAGEIHKSSENSDHIDLTLRKDKNRDERTTKLTDDSALKVIPVKVIYDQHDTKTTQSLTDLVTVSNDMVSNAEENSNMNTDKLHLKDMNITIDATTHIMANYSEEKESPTSKDSVEVIKNLPEQSTESYINTTMLIGSSKGNRNYDNSFEHKDSTTYRNSITIKKDPTQSDIDYTTGLPVTAEVETKFAINNIENNSMPSLTTSVSAVKSTTTEILKSNQNVNETDFADIDKNIEYENGTSTRRNDTKQHLRVRYSDEDRLKKEMTHKRKPKPIKTSNIKKQYFVYEVPEERPVFVHMTDSIDNEQPYVVPIYNFAAKNAYYNPQNHFGPNNDKDANDVITPNPMYDRKALLDKEFYLRNGVEIDVNPKKPNDKRPFRSMKRTNHPHWPFLDKKKYYKGNNDFMRQIKIGLQQNSRSKPTHISPSQDRYFNDERNVRRSHKKSSSYELRLPSSDEKDHPYNSIHKYSDHIRAIENLFYKQQIFGFLPPESYPTTVEPSHKRAFNGGYGVDFDRKVNDKVKNIAMDYYFSLFKSGNKTNEDFDYMYPDIEVFRTTEKPIHKTFNQKHNTVFAEHHRMINDKCEGECKEIDSKSDENFEKYLDSFIKILKDMIYKDKNELASYDWLLSTVDMEGAVDKLLQLTYKIEKGKHVHPLDFKLLNFVVYLYNTAKNTEENNLFESNNESKALKDIKYILKSFLNLLRRRIALPKIKNKKLGKKTRNPIRLWYRYYIRAGDLNSNNKWTNDVKLLRSFKKFLKDLKDNMFELHNALKHIALITTYKTQDWYRDLKNIYFKSASQKQLLQVVLHLAASRLFSSIEESAKNAEVEEYYVINNRDVVRRIREEFVLVLRILERMRKIK